jgi:hypothetical protein
MHGDELAEALRDVAKLDDVVARLAQRFSTSGAGALGPRFSRSP